uniref:Uncharacterized protein n=1 Tax=Cannabis sativa TaxID=3483 RepID=A0A803QDN9_CANSA
MEFLHLVATKSSPDDRIFDKPINWYQSSYFHGPKKDAMSEIIEEKVGAKVSDLRQDVQRVTQGMEKLQGEIQTTIESIVAKQMESDLRYSLVRFETHSRTVWTTASHELKFCCSAATTPTVGFPVSNEELLSVVQTGTVKEYRVQWEILASRVPDVPDHILEGGFVKGLKEEIKATLHILQPQGLAHIMETAQRIEEGHQLMNSGPLLKPNSSKHSFGSSSVARSNYSNFPSRILPAVSQQRPYSPLSVSTASMTSKIRSTRSATGTSYKRLTEAEYQEKHSRGLYFICDKKFHPGRECEQKLLQILLTADEEELDSPDENPPLSPDSGETLVTEETLATLSLNSLVGLSTANTMKLASQIGNQTVTVLIDSGATHNFVLMEVFAAVGLPISATTCYGILLGTGGKGRTEGICSQVELDLGEIQVITDFLPLELGGADVILGIKWLETEKYASQLENDGDEIRNGGNMGDIARGPELIQLLEQYEDVFELPPGLPPQRQRDHTITLKPNTGPISVRPYCYAQIKKAHATHLRLVLDRLRHHRVYANKKKYLFAQAQVDYLGHVISAKGVAVDPSKIEAMLRWPTPSTIKDLRGFLGLTGYYYKFVQGYEHQKWLTKILGYDFDIQYKPGLENRTVDALSHVSSEVSLAAISVPGVFSTTDLQATIVADPDLAKIMSDIARGQDCGGFSVTHGCLTFCGRLVLSAASPSIPLLLQEYHNSKMGGHSGVFKTFQRLAADFYWRGMRKDVQNFVDECSVCQQNKYLAQLPAGLLQPLPFPEQMWEDISTNFIEGLPTSNGFASIFVVVDRLTKYGHFIPLRHPFLAITVAAVFVKEYRLSPSIGWPNGGGQSLSRNLSPLLFEEVLTDRDAILALLKQNLLRAQRQMKSQADRKRRDVHFAVGDLVYVKLRPYHQRSLAKRPNEKLSPRFFGPFPVLARIGPAAYRLQLPPDSLIHHVFHVSLLRAALGPQQQASPRPLSLSADLEWLLEPEALFAIRPGTRKTNPQALIKWRNLPDFEATCEDFSVIQTQFPHFHLEDKVRLQAGGIDRPPVTYVYACRSRKSSMGSATGNNVGV